MGIKKKMSSPDTARYSPRSSPPPRGRSPMGRSPSRRSSPSPPRGRSPMGRSPGRSYSPSENSPRGGRSRSPGRFPPRLFIGNLPSGTDKPTDKDLEELFGKYGRIFRVDVKEGYGFVEFESEKEMRDALVLDGELFRRHKIRVQKSLAAQGVSNPRSSRVKPGTGDCFTCGREGHWAKECPKRRLSRSDDRRDFRRDDRRGPSDDFRRNDRRDDRRDDFRGGRGDYGRRPDRQSRRGDYDRRDDFEDRPPRERRDDFDERPPRERRDDFENRPSRDRRDDFPIRRDSSPNSEYGYR